jgi:hypothetical protein
MSPDPYYGSYDQSNPQSMDRYAYVSSSPLTFTDPSGLGPCLTVTFQWVDGPAQSNGGHGDEGTTVASYLCDGFSGGSGAGSASAPRPCNPAKSHCGHTQQTQPPCTSVMCHREAAPPTQNTQSPAPCSTLSQVSSYTGVLSLLGSAYSGAEALTLVGLPAAVATGGASFGLGAVAVSTDLMSKFHVGCS